MNRVLGRLFHPLKRLEKLRERSGLPVELWDERLSSVAAHEILDEAGHDRKDRKQIIDQVAAVVILRGWMEANQDATAMVLPEPPPE